MLLRPFLLQKFNFVLLYILQSKSILIKQKGIFIVATKCLFIPKATFRCYSVHLDKKCQVSTQKKALSGEPTDSNKGLSTFFLGIGGEYLFLNHLKTDISWISSCFTTLT